MPVYVMSDGNDFPTVHNDRTVSIPVCNKPGAVPAQGFAYC